MNDFDAPYDKKSIRYVEYGDSTLIVDVSHDLEITNEKIKENIDKEVEEAAKQPWFVPTGRNKGVLNDYKLIQGIKGDDYLLTGKAIDLLPRPGDFAIPSGETTALTKINQKREVMHRLHDFDIDIQKALHGDMFALNEQTTINTITQNVTEYLKQFTHKDHVDKIDIHCYAPTWKDYYPSEYTRKLAQEAVKLHGDQHTRELPEHLYEYPYIVKHSYRINWHEDGELCQDFIDFEDMPFLPKATGPVRGYSENFEQDALMYLESVYPEGATFEPLYRWTIKNPEGVMEVGMNFVPQTSIQPFVQFRAQIETSNMTIESVINDVNKTCDEDLDSYKL